MIIGDKIKDIGTIKVASKQEITFPIETRVGNVKITSPCSCSKVRVDNKNRKIVITYYPKAVPKHLQAKGIYHYETKKTFQIDDEKGERLDEFTFKAKVVQ